MQATSTSGTHIAHRNAEVTDTVFAVSSVDHAAGQSLMAWVIAIVALVMVVVGNGAIPGETTDMIFIIMSPIALLNSAGILWMVGKTKPFRQWHEHACLTVLYTGACFSWAAALLTHIVIWFT